MKKTLAALALLLLAFGCKDKSATTSQQQPVTTEQTAQAQTTSLSPEQLGEIGAQIKKHPSDMDKILADHNLTQASFEKEIRRVASDPAASRRYRDAYKKNV